MKFEKKRSCDVRAGKSVKWEGHLTPSQCDAFPVLINEWENGLVGGIGQGSFASAYEHARDPNRVIKFTADKQDAIASAGMIGKDIDGAVRVYDVAKLKGQAGTAPVMGAGFVFKDKDNQAIYAIETERLGQPTFEQLEAIDAFWRAYKGKPNDRKAPRQVARTIPPERFSVSDVVSRLTVFDDCIKDYHHTSRESCSRDLDAIFDAVDEVAAKAGVVPLDLHDGNWGTRNGRLAILDMGVSDVKNPPKIRQLAGTGAKGKKMAKRKHRRSLGQTDMAVYDPSQPSRVTGFNWSNPWVIGGAAAALGLIAWFAFGGKKDKKKKPSPTSSGSSAAPASGGGVVLPVTASSTTPTAPQRVRAVSGDSWSTIARKYYGDTRWWPALWDANRSGGSKFSDPSLLRVGDEVVVPVLPVTDSAFRAAVFARAKAYQTWYLTAGRNRASAPLPASVTEFTSVPTQNAAAGTQVSSQTAAESSSGQKSLPPASSSPPMSDQEKLQSDANESWDALDLIKE